MPVLRIERVIRARAAAGEGRRMMQKGDWGLVSLNL